MKKAAFLQVMRPIESYVSGLDLHKDAGRNHEPVQGFDGAVVGFRDVDDSLVRANFKLLTRLLVDERTTVHRIDLTSRRKRDWTSNPGAGALCMIHDFPSAGVQRLVVVGFHPNSNLAAVHPGN